MDTLGYRLARRFADGIVLALDRAMDRTRLDRIVTNIEHTEEQLIIAHAEYQKLRWWSVIRRVCLRETILCLEEQLVALQQEKNQLETKLQEEVAYGRD